MKITVNALWLGASMALMAAMVTPTMADEWNKETVLEFSGPVEVPGKVLTPGKYVFKIADSESDRNIVQIFSEDANGARNLWRRSWRFPTTARRRRRSRSFSLKSGRRAAPRRFTAGFIRARTRDGSLFTQRASGRK